MTEKIIDTAAFALILLASFWIWVALP